MSVVIKEVISNRDLDTFIRFPIDLYRNDPYYVPAMFADERNTLRQDRNAAFEYCQSRYFLAYKHNRLVGRIAAIVNQRHQEKWDQKYLRFGWFDFIDDMQVSAALLQEVESWARLLGLEAVHGPLGFTDLDREGMLIEGFDQVATLATLYNHPYYPHHMTQHGYAKDIDWVEYEIQVPPSPEPTIARIASLALRRHNLHLVKPRSKAELLTYADGIFALLEDAYSHLYGTVPLSRRQVDSYIKQYFSFIHPDFVPIVLDEQGKLVAFGVVLPSLSTALQKSRGFLFPSGFLHILKALRTYNRFDLYLVAVSSAYQSRGVNAILMDRMNQVFARLGVHVVESNPELETNANVQGQWKYYQHRQHKRRRVFKKNVV